MFQLNSIEHTKAAYSSLCYTPLNLKESNQASRLINSQRLTQRSLSNKQQNTIVKNKQQSNTIKNIHNYECDIFENIDKYLVS